MPWYNVQFDMQMKSFLRHDEHKVENGNGEMYQRDNNPTIEETTAEGHQ